MTIQTDPDELSSRATTHSDPDNESIQSESSAFSLFAPDEESFQSELSESSYLSDPDWSIAPSNTTVFSDMSDGDQIPLNMDIIPSNYDPHDGLDIDEETDYELVLDRMHFHLGSDATVDIDNINFVVQSPIIGQPFTRDAKRLISHFILKTFGMGTMDMYSRKPLSDGHKWQIHHPNRRMRFSNRHECLLIHKPFEVALLVTEIHSFMVNHFVPQKHVTLLENYTQKGFIIDAARLRNPPTVIDFITAFIDSDLSYLHFSLAGQRHKIGGPIDACGMLFNQLQHFIDAPSIRFNYVQVDVAVESQQHDIVPNELPQWGITYLYESIADHKLGGHLTRRIIPSWNLHGRSNVFKEKFGSVNLEWQSTNPVGRHQQHHGRASRGIYQIKCYATHAHFSRNFLGSYCDPNFDFRFTTVRHAKLELARAEDDIKEMMDYTNIRHRMEIVWSPNNHYQTLKLLQFINLALWVRVHVLPDYKIAPVPTGNLPDRTGVLLRTHKVIIQLRAFLTFRDSTAITSKNIGPIKLQRYSAMYALMLLGLGLSSVRLFQIFHRWMDNDIRRSYDPQGWHALLNPHHGWIQTFNEENSIMDNSMNFQSETAARYLKFKLSRDAHYIVREELDEIVLGERYMEVYKHLESFNQRVLSLINFSSNYPWVSTRAATMMPGQHIFADDLPSVDSANIHEEEELEVAEEVQHLYNVRTNLDVHRDANNIQNIPHIDVHDDGNNEEDENELQKRNNKD